MHGKAIILLFCDFLHLFSFLNFLLILTNFYAFTHYFPVYLFQTLLNKKCVLTEIHLQMKMRIFSSILFFHFQTLNQANHLYGIGINLIFELYGRVTFIY